MNAEIHEMTESELSNVNGGDALLVIAIIVAAVAAVVGATGNGDVSAAAGGEGDSWWAEIKAMLSF